MHWKLRGGWIAALLTVVGCDLHFLPGQVETIQPSGSLAAGTAGPAPVAPPGAGVTGLVPGSPQVPGEPALAPQPQLASENLAVPPERLSETGLFDASSRLLSLGVESYSPAYELWSDSADKHRWVSLPPSAQIDTSNMDVWAFPVGTKLWKQFDRAGRAIETRYMVKFGPADADWAMLAYQWNAEGTEANAVPSGVANASGTTHDIPPAAQCHACHNNRPAITLGFSAIQLSHAGPGVTLDGMAATGRLSAPPTTPVLLPGDAIAQHALGYLHANCGGCHNRSTPFLAGATRVVFWQSAAQLASVEQTTTYVDMIASTNGDLATLRHGLDRMRTRSAQQMPPLATEEVDPLGVALVEAWLRQLSTRPWN